MFSCQMVSHVRQESVLETDRWGDCQVRSSVRVSVGADPSMSGPELLGYSEENENKEW